MVRCLQTKYTNTVMNGMHFKDKPHCIELHLRLRVAPGRRDEFLAFLRDAIPYYEAPGGIRIRLLQDREEPDLFIEVVEYRDRAAYETDQVRVESEPGMRERIKSWRSLLAEPPQVEIYEIRAVDVVPPARGERS
jgi:quinol monooxygenase YgiN